MRWDWSLDYTCTSTEMGQLCITFQNVNHNLWNCRKVFDTARRKLVFSLSIIWHQPIWVIDWCQLVKLKFISNILKVLSHSAQPENTHKKIKIKQTKKERKKKHQHWFQPIPIMTLCRPLQFYFYPSFVILTIISIYIIIRWGHIIGPPSVD